MKIVCNNFKSNEIIKMLREYLELTQEEFGKIINKKYKTIQNYEYGYRNYDFELLLNIAKKIILL